MSVDRSRPGLVANRQRDDLVEYVNREVYAYAPYWRGVLDRAGVGGSVRTPADLGKVPTSAIDDLAACEGLVLQPSRQTIVEHGDRRLRYRLAWAGLTGRKAQFAAEEIDARYKPIAFHRHGSLLVGNSAHDLDRLADLGRRWLEAAGVSRRDVIANLLPVGSDLAGTQLASGARDGGVAIVNFADQPTPDAVAAVEATVLAGRPDQIGPLLTAGAGSLGRLTTVVVVGLVGPDLLSRLRALTPATVVPAHAPPGVRAVWSACAGADALHTWPDAELVEVVGEADELVWTPVAWAGTVTLRLATGMRVAVHSGTCPTCRRTSQRVEPLGRVADPVDVLDGHGRVALWQLQRAADNGQVAMTAYVQPNGRKGLDDLRAELTRALGGVDVVWTSKRDLTRLLRDHDGVRVVDVQ